MEKSLLTIIGAVVVFAASIGLYKLRSGYISQRERDALISARELTINAIKNIASNGCASQSDVSNLYSAQAGSYLPERVRSRIAELEHLARLCMFREFDHDDYIVLVSVLQPRKTVFDNCIRNKKFKRFFRSILLGNIYKVFDLEIARPLHA